MGKIQTVVIGLIFLISCLGNSNAGKGLQKTGTTVLQGILLEKKGDVYYIRTAWSDTDDLMQEITLSTGSVTTNNVVNFSGARLISKSIAPELTARAFSTGRVLAIQGDDATPIFYNGTFMGANHGPSFAVALTAAGHGKVTADIGSEWIDARGRKFYLIKVVNSNVLWFLSENIGTEVGWVFDTNVKGVTLTHSADAINTATINFTASEVVQILPVVQSQQKRVTIDGEIQPTADGIYYTDKINFFNAYDLPNIAALLTSIRARAGSSIAPDFSDPSVAKGVRMTVVYSFAPNGSCTVYHTIRTYEAITLGHAGIVQALALNYSGNELWQYIPNTLPVVGRLKTWDFAAGEDISTEIESISMTSSHWANDRQPNRMAQLVKTPEGLPIFGFLCGISPLHGIGQLEKRKRLVNEAIFLYTSRKQYPRGLTSTETI